MPCPAVSFKKRFYCTCKDMLDLSLMLTASIVRRLHNCVACLHKGGLQVSVASSHGNVIRTACGVDYQ